MANPTTYFGWVMPTSTDLVTDLPADFNVFGQGVDTSMQDLLGGTTGQVLSKTSNTNMDFTWVTPTDQTPLTTKGDLFTFSTVDARLGVGTDGQTLVADSTASTGLKWATPAGGGKILQVVGAQLTTQVATSSSTFSDSGLTGTITPSAASSKILVLVSCTVNKSAGNSLNRVALRLLRGATTIVNITGGASVSDHYGLFTNTAETGNGGYGTEYVDSPNTTSATTYKIQFANPNNTAQIEMNPGNGTSSLVLMEIGA